MSVMEDKGQIPPPWQQYQPMYYGGFNNYQFSAYPAQPQVFNYYHGAVGLPQPFMPMNGQHPTPQMMHGQVKPFTPGGILQPFGQEQVATGEEKERGKTEEGGLPPLPPGPPPSQEPLESPVKNNFFQPNNTGGAPIRFNMNRQQPRPQFSQQQTVGPFNNSGSAKKKRKKKNKFNQQFQQQQQFGPRGPANQMMRAPPPLPPQMNTAPPLPPGPPPSSPKPPPEDIAVPPEPKPKPAESQPEFQDNWPPELQNFIKRSYERCQNDVDKDRVSIILKGRIMKATNEGTLWVKDWTKEPLPLPESEKETISIQPFKVGGNNQNQPNLAKKRMSMSLVSRLGQRLRSRSRSRSDSRSRSRSRSRSPHSKRARSPARNRRNSRKDRSGSSGSENDWIPMSSAKKNKNRQQQQQQQQGNTASKRGKGKNKGKGRGNFYSEFGSAGGEVPVNNELLEKRAARFSGGSSTARRTAKATKNSTLVTFNNSNMFEDTNGDFDLEECHVVGVCQDIEKPYLRLTAAPEASAVRPPEVLKQSLARVKQRWVQNQDYHYVCEQLKSIRQDLTVQGIRDKLTVSVYETHARIALEKGDHAEFNQCQSQLKLLYDEIPSENCKEFTAYRILYFIFTKENMDLTNMLMSLSASECKDECIAHALNVRSAWALNNYHRLFLLYRSAPRMASYLMDWFAPRERKVALKTMIKAYRQTLPVSFVTQELAFATDAECRDFAAQFGIIYADDERTKIDCKASAPVVASA